MTSPRAAEPVLQAFRQGDYRRAADLALRLLHGGGGVLQIGRIVLRVEPNPWRHSGWDERGYLVDGRPCPICNPVA